MTVLTYFCTKERMLLKTVYFSSPAVVIVNTINYRRFNHEMHLI